MAANDRQQRWRQELQHLQALRAELILAWERSLLQLRATGQPPEPDLLDQDADYARWLTALANDIALDHPHWSLGGELSLEGLSAACDELAKTQQARQVLEQILQWEHASEPDFEPLRIVQAQARRTLHEISRTPLTEEHRAAWEALAQHEHPLCDLWRLQCSGSELDDHAWTGLLDRVAEQFGRPLATAIGRGRIHSVADSASTAAALVEEPSVTEHEAEVHAAEPNPVPPRKTEDQPGLVFDFAAPATRMTGVLDPALDRVIDSLPASPTGAPLLNPAHAPRANGADIQPPDDVTPHSGLLEAWTVLRENRVPRSNEQSHETPAAALAEAASLATGEERVRCMFRLIDQLLIDDQSALAYQLMRVLEGQGAERLTPLPSSLIRAVLLSRHVGYANGELMRCMDDDLKKQQPRRHQQFSPNDRLTYVFLCRAAALMPALLCSSSAAVRLLQAFPIEPGLIQLYNYCSRIASYAEKLQGKTAEMLQASDSGAAMSQELAALKDTARTWLTQSIKRTVPYTRSSPLFLHAHWTVMAGAAQRSPETAQLWSQWHETWLTVHRLLRPVIQGTGNERNWVKHELERLTPLLQPDPASHGRAASAEAQASQSAMRDALSQAVEFANGWLRLGGGSTSSISMLPLREMEELHHEIRERSAAVLAELRPYAAIQSPPSLRAATFCLLRIIQQIYALFESRIALAWREPELKHILHAELLKIPCMPMNDHWEPQIDRDDLEAELLNHVSHGARSWREAFDLHCRQGDHVATGRLLELSVWNSPAEHAELSELRQAAISESRRELQSDFDELLTEFQSLAAEGAFSSADQAAMQRRLDRLQSGMSRTLDFQITEIQIQQLRLMLERRNSGVRRNLAAAGEPATVSSNGKLLHEERPKDHESSTALVDPESANSWVMDLLWEDQ